MRLIIAEKHSVAQAIACAIGGTQAGRDGFIECPGALITWAQGHLIGLDAPDAYRSRGWDKWSLDDLPIDPSPDWQWHINTARGADKQYRKVERLLKRPDVTELVNACDPDREGEAIFRRIISYARIEKPTKRLWVASLEEEAIREALETMKPASEYEGLAAAADIRAKADWLIGMNASRAYSLLFDTRFTVGRVQTPTLAMVVERDRQIEGHVSTPFWRVVAAMGGWTLISGQLDGQSKAQRIREQASSSAFTIESVERKQQHDRPPHLYDLTGLQKDMSRLHGLTASRTLAALQSLYEKKLATYPRTDSQFITHDDLETLENLTAGERRMHGFIDAEVLPAFPRLELTVDDTRVAGHTAILPTERVDDQVLDSLSEDERLVLVRVVRRMWEAVGDDCVRNVVTVKASLLVDGEKVSFTSRSDVTMTLGWKSIEIGWEPIETTGNDDGRNDDGEAEERNVIPVNLEAPRELRAVGAASIKEGATKPPAPFTEASLLAAMEHASRYVDDKDLKAALDDDASHSGGIGTPATRAAVIDGLVNRAYLVRKGKQLRSTDLGRALVDVVAPARKSVRGTAEMERLLKAVEQGRQDPESAMMFFRNDAGNILSQARASVDLNHQFAQALARAEEPEPMGVCPRCGQQVVKVGKIFKCSSNHGQKQADGTWKDVAGCGFKIFSTVAGKTLTDEQVRKILEGRKVAIKGFTSKAGKKFDANLILDKDKGVSFDFGK